MRFWLATRWHWPGALRKIDHAARRLLLPAEPELQTTSEMMIAHPFTGDSLARWFSTHPPVPERVARLQRMARTRLASTNY